MSGIPEPIDAPPSSPAAAGPLPQVGRRGVARSPLSDGDWHRLHPLTPLFRGGLVLVVAVGIVIANLRDRIIELFLPWLVPDFPDGAELPGDPVDYVLGHGLVLLATLVLLGAVIVVVGLFYLSWRFHTFRITGDDVEVKSGVLFRSQRRAPLDRVQGVNLTRPLVARLCGMAKLEVVGAGSDANVRLEYLSTSNAEQVRADILRLASGRQLEEAREAEAHGTRTAAAAAMVTDALNGLVQGAEDPADEPESVVAIPFGRLLASRVLDGSLFGLLFVAAVVVGGSIAGTPWLLLSFIPAGLAFGTYWVRSILKSLRYSIAPTVNGVRITFGLLTTVTEILPPGRVHAVEVTQPLLWRPFGWWSVTVNRLHGGNANGRNAEQFSTVLPVGDRADVERVLRLLLPALDEKDWPNVFAHGILGPQADDPYTNTPRRALLLRPVTWRRNGFLLASDALLLRRGYLHRKLIILPLARLQSLSLEQGPVDRAFAVAAAHAHTIAGRVSGRLGAIDRDAALALFADAERGAVSAAATDTSHRWAGATAAPLHPSAVPPEDTR